MGWGWDVIDNYDYARYNLRDAVWSITLVVPGAGFLYFLFSDQLQCEVAALAPPTGEEARSSSEGDVQAEHTGTEL